MLAPDTCMGSLVELVQNIRLFFVSKEGQAILSAFWLTQLILVWLWRLEIPEARQFAIAIAVLFGVVVLVIMKQSAVFDVSFVAKCFPSEEPKIAKARKGVARS